MRPSADESRLIGVFLDEYHVSPGATDQVRSAMERFVAEQVRPRDLLVVLKPLDSLLAIQTSTDRTAALQAIRSFEGRRGEYDARNAYERNFMAGVPARIEAARNQVVISALNALAVHFSTFLDQRKTLIVVSEGVARVEHRRGLEYLPTLETIRRSAQQANVAIYAVNPGDALAHDADSLAMLATETSGQSFSVDVDTALRRASEDAGAYYLLTYRASRPDDGRFHAVEVRIKRPGTQLRARPGYYSPSPDDALRRALLDKLAHPTPPPPPEPAPHASTLIRPWFGTARGANGKTRVTIVWEPTARALSDRLKRIPTQLKVTALAGDDSVLFEGAILPTGAGAMDDPGGPQSRASFEVTPGRLRLRMAVLDAAQAVLDTDIRTISVRDMSGVSIATPEVLRARNAREFRALDNVLAVPVAAREFSRTERLFIRFRAYGTAAGDVTVGARLLSRMGPMRQLPVAAIDDGGLSKRQEIDVPLAGLAAGDYVIEVSASGPGGEAKDVIDFRVTT